MFHDRAHCHVVYLSPVPSILPCLVHVTAISDANSLLGFIRVQPGMFGE